MVIRYENIDDSFVNRCPFSATWCLRRVFFEKESRHGTLRLKPLKVLPDCRCTLHALHAPLISIDRVACATGRFATHQAAINEVMLAEI